MIKGVEKWESGKEKNRELNLISSSNYHSKNDLYDATPLNETVSFWQLEYAPR